MKKFLLVLAFSFTLNLFCNRAKIITLAYGAHYWGCYVDTYDESDSYQAPDVPGREKAYEAYISTRPPVYGKKYYSMIMSGPFRGNHLFFHEDWLQFEG